MTKFYTIFSMHLAGFLMMRGFVLMDISANTDGTGKKVFHFKESQRLHNAIEDYKLNYYE